MKNAIITCCDAKYGDALINNWLKSLEANVDKSNLDMIVVDYGLTKEQISKLKDMIIYKGTRDGHVNLVRFRDIAKFLDKNRYDQVMMTDGGDIIFQTGLKELFDNNKNEFRAACEDFYIDFRNVFMRGSFTKENIKKINKVLDGKKMVNAGVIIGPYHKFKKMCKEAYRLLINKQIFGPDQIAVNYILYRDGFKLIENKFNFIPLTSRKRFSIKNGIFYFKDGEKIPIVHNAGNKKFFRPIKNFGYGKTHNQIKLLHFLILRNFYRISSFLRK